MNGNKALAFFLACVLAWGIYVFQQVRGSSSFRSPAILDLCCIVNFIIGWIVVACLSLPRPDLIGKRRLWIVCIFVTLIGGVVVLIDTKTDAFSVHPSDTRLPLTLGDMANTLFVVFMFQILCIIRLFHVIGITERRSIARQATLELTRDIRVRTPSVSVAGDGPESFTVDV